MSSNSKQSQLQQAQEAQIVTGAAHRRRQRSPSIPSLLTQAVLVSLPSAVEKEWQEDELLDTVYWMRQTLAVVSGVFWGFLPLTGLWAFLGYLALINLTVIIFVNTQQIEIDDFGGPMVFMEGLPPAIATFLLFWIGTYTAAHSDIS